MFWRSALAVALLGIVASSRVLALGLGDIEINSVLNNPLQAVVELTSATDAELEELKVSIASSEAFARVGISRTRILNDFKFSAERTPAGKPVIRLSTTEPVREAFLEFLLEVAWSRGRLVRQYTVLVDPPLTMPAVPVTPRPPVTPVPSPVSVQPAPEPAPRVTPPPELAPVSPPAQVAPAPPRVEPAPPPPRVAPAPPPPRVAPAPPPAPRFAAPAPATAAEQYGPVRRNETLWDISKKLRPDSEISVQQMMLALQRANPGAFINNNINNLRAGAILRVPDRDEVIALSRSDAIAEARRQHAEWRTARSGATATAPQPAAEPEPAPMVTEESATGMAAETRLQLVAPEDDAVAGAAGTAALEAEAEAQPGAEDAAASGKIEQQLALATEEAEAGRAQSAELRSRVSKLEEQVEAMKRLIELKDAELAGMQNRLGQEAGAMPDMTAEDEVADEPMPAAVESPLAEELELSPAVTGTEPQVVEEEIVVVDKVEDISGTQQARKLVDRLLENPVLTALGVLAAMVLGGFLWATTRQRDKDDIFSDEPTMESQLADAQHEPHEPQEQRREPVIPPVVPADMVEEHSSQRAEADTVTQPDTESGDPLTEADVYIAYGRYEQAAHVIEDALQSSPEDPELTLKLLEIHHVSGNTKDFNTLAAGFHEVAGEDSPLWDKVATMGYELAPDNPLYTGEVDGPVIQEIDNEPDLDLYGKGEATSEDVLAEDLASLEEIAASDEPTDNTIEFNLDDDTVSAEEELDEGPLEMSDEVATKLDLARAYVDMSDPESARSILEEVLQEGDEKQKSEAEELFAKLAEF